jgi:hypothetical protein
LKVLQTEAIRNLGWGDARFFGFVWENGGKDLKLLLVHASKPIYALTCHWASDLRVVLNWRRPQTSTEKNPIRRGGGLLTWDTRFETTSDGRWKVLVDFTLTYGYISFECAKITAIMEDHSADEA